MNSPTPDNPIFIVDDDPKILDAVETALRMAGFDNITAIQDSRDVIRTMERRIPGLVLLDLNMPHISGGHLLKSIRKTWPRIPVIVLTGNVDVDTAVQCMKIGAMDYILKPVDPARLVKSVKQALDGGQALGKFSSSQRQALFAQIKKPAAFSAIITQDSQMHAIFHYVEAVAPSPQPVLIFGETGVGKELISQCIHNLSGRKGKLVKVNVAGLDDNVFSDTLFGHVPGAFTSAQTARPGLILQASGGTLMLDEIGDLALSSQVKLLRLLQGGDYLALGSDITRHSDTRIIASTNQDLWALEKQGKFRKDLIYRLSTHKLTIPPLRERLLDIPLLLDRFICQAADELDKPVPDIPKRLIETMETYPFKGNIRELKSMVYDAMSRYQGGAISADLFNISTYEDHGPGASIPLNQELPTLKQASNALVEKVMAHTGGNQSAASKILGISQQALSKRLQKLRGEV
ncbi:sigma-54-dependent transcriptional regulator [Desulfobacter sp.]|uniref:sigma-54-dependent transcriptional regulator n=1 Tax=Desulfobacter sp. TaxID=2294 RepID=UPI003D0F13EB